MKKSKSSKPSVHNAIVKENIANRILKDARGVLILENNDRQYQKGDLITFTVEEEGICLENTWHGLKEQAYEVTNVYSGRGIEPGYVVLLIDYKCPKDEIKTEEDIND